MIPPSEHVHWWFATGALLLGICLLARAIVGPEIWDRRPWRAYLWPSLLFVMGLLMFPVQVFFTNSTIHMVAHGSWAQVMMLAGGVHLGLIRGKLNSQYWRLTMPFAFLVSGAAFLLHEQHGFLYTRSAFVHHVCGWTLVVGSIFPLLAIVRPRWSWVNAGFALTFVVLAVVLYTARDTAPIFGHFNTDAGVPHR